MVVTHTYFNEFQKRLYLLKTNFPPYRLPILLKLFRNKCCSTHGDRTIVFIILCPLFSKFSWDFQNLLKIVGHLLISRLGKLIWLLIGYNFFQDWPTGEDNGTFPLSNSLIYELVNFFVNFNFNKVHLKNIKMPQREKTS